MFLESYQRPVSELTSQITNLETALRDHNLYFDARMEIKILLHDARAKKGEYELFLQKLNQQD